MGKRKERRIAAMASSRRMKLDIFAEPSGDPGGSPVQDEFGGDTNPRQRDESPNSPSSSGKQPENPLMLLGQYSDEELDEQLSKNGATPEKASYVDREQENRQIATGNEDRSGGYVSSDALDDKEHDLDEDKPGQIDATGTNSLCKEEVFVEETPSSVPFEPSFITDASTSWQVVLHEESGQYYYWNTVTGETSWVVPDLLAAGSESTGGQETISDEKSSSPLAGVKQLNSSLDVGLKVSSTVHTEHHSIASVRIDELEEKNESGLHKQEPIDDQKDDNLGDNKESSDTGETEKCLSNLMVHEDNDLDNDLSFSVLRHGELLLDRFKSMEGSRSQVGENGWISRYILEVEIRLSDAKSLLSFGSILLPFWVHCERKLKELEAAFNADVCQFFIDETLAVEAAPTSPEIEGSEIKSNKNETGVVVSNFGKPDVSAYVDISTVVQKDQQNETAHSSVSPEKHVISMENPKLHSGSSFEMKTGRSEIAQNSEVIPKTLLQDEENEDVDMDMDVDMEVEDTKELHFHPNPPVEPKDLLPQENFDVPPPPGEDWIPPPPSDSELVPPPPPDSELIPPPPPPDDPAEAFYPPPPPTDDQIEPSYPSLPTFTQTIQPLSYAEQYSFTYPSSNFEYYGQSRTEFPANNTYQQTEGSLLAVPNPSVYYEALPSSYLDAAPVVVNPVTSVAYYGLQDGAVIHAPVVSGAACSELHGDSVKISSVNLPVEISHASLPNADLGGSTVNGDTKKETKGASIVQTPASISNSVIESGPVPSATAAVTSDVSKPVVTNVQSKVLRSKKRAIAAAPTLRSNKKVSSLVDKWKAAKEELHDDEEEPENDYEIFEKKRQREIEKWKKQQIASGEAKDNANFQPLGGDWRERVKRKRAQLKKEDRKPPSEDTTDVNKQPDLGELSRDLPAGWQVYWDDSSKQVYYGNSITSVTTWTRPGK